MMPTRTPAPSPSSGATSSPGALGYLTAVAPIAFAAASPASDEPDTKIPGNRSCGRGGVSLKFLTVQNSPSWETAAAPANSSRIMSVYSIRRSYRLSCGVRSFSAVKSFLKPPATMFR